MILILEGLRGKNPSAKVTYGGNVSAGMTGNTHFSDAGTKLTALNDATAKLIVVNEAGVTADINTVVELFDNAMKALVMYAQTKILGIADLVAIQMVESANLKYKKQGKPIIADLGAEAGEEPLTVQLRKKVTTKRRKVAYVFQKCTDPALEANYVTCMISTIATVLISIGLKPQTKYWFRVAIVEGMVMSDFSDPISFTTA